MTRYTVGAHVGVVEANDAVFLAALPDGPIIRLSDTAAMIWDAALNDGGTVAAEVAAATGVVESQIAADVEAFLSDLVGRHLLVEVEAERY